MVSRNNDYLSVEPGREGGHLPLGTLIIKCRTRERERGGSLASRNNDY